MPFTLDDFQTINQYQAKLRSESYKVGANGYFAVFQKCTFGDGKAKTVLLVGSKQDRNLEQLLQQSGAKLKARGSCAFADGGLTLTPAHGSVSDSEVHGLGVNVVVSPGTKPETVEGEDERGQSPPPSTLPPSTLPPSTLPPSTFQRTTPSGAPQQAAPKLGSGEREAIAAFVKQRQDLLEFANTFLQNMEYFRERAGAAVVQANALISRADGGERSESLVQSIQGALRTVQELRQAANQAHEEQGTHVAKERQVNPAKFGLEGEVGVKVGARTQPLFQKITGVTQKAGAVNRDTVMVLDEAVRGLELSGAYAQTGQADLNMLLRYLDGVLESMSRPADLLDRSYAIDSILGNLSGAMGNNTAHDLLERMLNTVRQSMQSKEEMVAESLGQIQALCKAALTRIKQAPQNNPAVLERFEKVKAALSEATTKKRTFAENLKGWPDLEKQVVARLGQTA